MVDHLTRITARAGSEALERALADLGFTLRRERKLIIADSFTIGGREAKEALRARGFGDRDFQVHLEYVRQWGFL